MSRIALLDVNVLVALVDPEHVHHDLAHDWFASEGSAAWATCPLTQNGFLRVVSNPLYHGAAIRAADAARLLRNLCATSHHTFWSDVVSLADEARFDLSVTRGHRQLTDVYLLGLATRKGGRLATFDRTIPVGAVVGAGQDHLVLIAETV